MSMSTKAANPEKGKRYFGLLDQALCNGSWSEVQELARKTDKHAPERKCFTLTARTEAQIASASHRPTSASSTGDSSIHTLGAAVPKLEEAIAATSSSPEDGYCASACLAEIHWLQEDSEASLKALPRGSGPSKSNTGLAPIAWLEVCAAKCAFLRVAALEATGHDDEVQSAYLTAVTQTPGSRTPELRRWTERLLARACIHNLRRTPQPSLPALNESLRAFRAWASFWQRAPPNTIGSSASPSRVDVPRRAVWKAYYDLLSVILRHGLIYTQSTSAGSDLLTTSSEEVSNEAYIEAKTRQYAELKQVETTYESSLLGETQFPKATESNTEVEGWVEQAVANWKILCGSGWTDVELGEGGKEAASRRMLDILYRAAVKTFHSTAILRQLFHVHASLGEFDLAMHAFGSYEEIVGKGKARAQKTGKHELGADDDDSALLTAADAVRVLCRYGDREQAERALDVAKTIQNWLGPQRSLSKESRAEAARSPQPVTDADLSPITLAAAYRALGVSRAHWARMTYETEIRYSLQIEAVDYLRKAHEYNEHSIETSFALARVLAETQQISAALEVAKQSVASSSSNTNGIESEGEGDDASIVRQRKLLPVWHLLSLCLTARDEYESAFAMCEAAFDQFGDPSVLFGQSPNDSEKQQRASFGLVDHMDSFEKEAVLQIKMSELTFTELMEGANIAVDSTDELISLYARLFGNPEHMRTPSKPPPTALSAAPSQGGGTLRSIVGSIRPKTTMSTVERDTSRQPSGPSSLEPNAALSSQRISATNNQAFGAPISITVTNEDGVSAEKAHRQHDHHLHLPFKMRAHHGDFRSAGNLRSKNSVEDVTASDGALNGDEKPPPPPPKDTSVTDHAHPSTFSTTQPAVQQTMSATSPQQPLKHMQHNASHDVWPPPVGHDDQPPEQDIRLPTPHPASHASPVAHLAGLQERQHRASILVKVWLFTAGLYIRADHHDDASGAIKEAIRMVETFETDKGMANANARGLFEKGWGGGKSVDELWADVYTARGDLASARELPFEALSNYEQALAYFPDHPAGIIGVSNMLMDIYEEKMPAEPPKLLFEAVPSSIGPLVDLAGPSVSRPSTAKSNVADSGRTGTPNARRQDPTPAELNRLAARDRAYMLLSNLTRLGIGWDNSEAWYTLARAHELSKQMGKAKQALWWVVELEDNKPMRPWSEISAGGYAL